MVDQQSRNKHTIARVIDEVMNDGNLSLIDDLFADNLVEHDVHQSVAASPKKAFIEAVEMFRMAFPDNKMIVDGQIAEADCVATRWHMVGTHLGRFMGIEPSGKKINVTGIFYDRLANGKLIETWANYDLFGLMEQMKE